MLTDECEMRPFLEKRGIQIVETDLDTIRAFLTSDQFVLPGFKGVGMAFRHWNHQLRQPMLIAWARSLVSVSPQEVFLHEHFATDTLGYDEPDSSCHLDRN